MKLKIGDSGTLQKTFTNEDVIKFSDISLDVNPIHLNDDYASKSIFKKRIVHGILVSGLISAVIANKMPGIGSIYLKQNLVFHKPVYIGETITAEVIIKDIRADKPIVTLITRCYNENKKTVIDGEAVVMV